MELIEITGAHQFDACDRAIQNKLFQHAHDSGQMTDVGAKWEFTPELLAMISRSATIVRNISGYAWSRWLSYWRAFMRFSSSVMESITLPNGGTSPNIMPAIAL